jgi:hypothetical protein
MLGCGTNSQRGSFLTCVVTFQYELLTRLLLTYTGVLNATEETIFEFARNSTNGVINADTTYKIIMSVSKCQSPRDRGVSDKPSYEVT